MEFKCYALPFEEMEEKLNEARFEIQESREFLEFLDSSEESTTEEYEMAIQMLLDDEEYLKTLIEHLVQ